MNYIECDGQLFTTDGTTVFRYETKSQARHDLVLENFGRIKKIQFFPNDATSIFLLLNQRICYQVAAHAKKIHFFQHMHVSEEPILYIVSLHEELYMIGSHRIVNPRRNLHVNMRESIHKYQNICFHPQLYHYVPLPLFFRTYQWWLYQKRILHNYSTKTMINRIYLYLAPFRNALTSWMFAMYQETKTASLRLLDQQLHCLIFTDALRNLVIFDTTLERFQTLNHAESNVYFVCYTPTQSFLVLCYRREPYWHLQFYRPNLPGQGMSMFFTHDYYKASVDMICSMFYSKGRFFVMFRNQEKELFYDFLFEETDKLYTSYQSLSLAYLDLHAKHAQLSSFVYQPLPEIIKSETQNLPLPKCCICYETNVNIMFFPCNHCCCCSKCSTLVQKNECPICRSVIMTKRLVYF